MALVVLSGLDLDRNYFIVRLKQEIYLPLLLAVEIVQIPAMRVELLSYGILKYGTIVHIHISLQNLQLYAPG